MKMHTLFSISYYLLLISILSFGLIASNIFRVKIFLITAESMQPHLDYGDIIFTLKQKQYSKNDVVTFKLGAMPVTHRIYGIQNSIYITKGDANNVPDPNPIAINGIYGREFFRIPTSYIFRIMLLE